jgi:hypothetical protein
MSKLGRKFVLLINAEICVFASGLISDSMATAPEYIATASTPPAPAPRIDEIVSSQPMRMCSGLGHRVRDLQSGRVGTPPEAAAEEHPI